MICSHCFNSTLEPENAFLVRTSGNKWEMRCPQCRENNNPRPAVGALLWLNPDGSADDSPEIRRVVTEILLAGGKIASADSGADKRAYERYRVKMDVRYRLPGAPEDAWNSGEMLDLSKGGLGFVADVALKVGEIIPVRIVSNRPQQAKVDFRGEVEIKRCSPASGGFAIGAKFLEKNPEENRRDPRHNVLFNVWYQRPGRSGVSQGTLVDISRGGVALIVTQSVPVGEVLFVCVRGDSGIFKNQEIRALVRVVRSTCVYAGNYEIGTEFLRTKVSPYLTTDDVMPQKITI